MTVHILEAGLPLCGFSSALPRDWPEGHRWVSLDDRAPLNPIFVQPNEYDAKRCADCEKKRELIVQADPVLVRHFRGPR